MNWTIFLLDRPNLLGFLGECAVIVFCFSGLRNKSDRRWLALAGASLLLNLLLYATGGQAGGEGGWLHFVLRAGFHAAVVWLYLRCAKAISLRESVMLSLLYLGGYQFSLGVRLLVSAVSLGRSALIAQLLCTFTVLLIQFVWALVIRYIVHISDMRHISLSRWGVVGTLNLLQIYIRWSLMPSLRELMEMPAWFRQVEYPLIAMAGLLLVEVFYEISISMQARASRAQTEKLTLEYELKNTRQQSRSADDIRRVYHDMKNHLLAIGSMDSSGQVRDYTRQLLSQFDSFETMVSTGNTAADALISEKMLLARLDQISFNVCMDLQSLDFVSPVDIVSIFGNALDNAMEAVRALPAEKRRVYLKSVNTPGFVTLIISNPYETLVRDDDGNLVTTKEDRDNHGIGLKSIRHAAERYDGVIRVRQDESRQLFDLTVLLPLR